MLIEEQNLDSHSETSWMTVRKRMFWNSLENPESDETNGGKLPVSQNPSNTDAISLAVPIDEHQSAGIRNQRRRFFTYKTTLITHDLLIVLAAFLLNVKLFENHIVYSANWLGLLGLLFFSLVIIAFFSSYNLYNYHLIFRPQYHVFNILKSFTMSLISLSMAIGICLWQDMLESHYFIPTILVVAFTVMICSRFIWNQVLNLLKAIGIAFLFLGVSGFMSTQGAPLLINHAGMLLTTFAISAVMLLGCRLFIIHFLFNVVLRRHFRRQVVIVGSNQDAQNIANHIINHNAPFWVTGVVSNWQKRHLNLVSPKDCLGKLDTLPSIIKKYNVSEIIVTDEQIDKRTLITLLDFCTSTGLNAWFPPKLLPIIDIKLVIDKFCGIPMIRLCTQRNTWLFNKIKHSFDALITLPMFIFQLPLFLTIAAAIKLDSEGPVFYKARAIGRNGRAFKMFKFRTMYVNNDNRIHKEYVTKLIKGEIENDKDANKPLKITNDPRVTRIGNLLRKTSLDELPQMINIIKGEMSLVGPRPCLPYEYEIYEDWQKKRTYVRGGITGLWQVAGRSAVSFEDMILLDLYYIYNRNLIMDFNILYETVFVVLGKKGAY